MTELIIVAVVGLIVAGIIVTCVTRSEKREKQLEDLFEEIWREL